MSEAHQGYITLLRFLSHLIPQSVFGLLLLMSSSLSFGQSSWSFAVSGDSRNCGNVEMPAIARKIHEEQSAFYWHLGDFRAMKDFDEDLVAEPRNSIQRVTIEAYQSGAWADFLEHRKRPSNAPVSGMGFVMNSGHECGCWRVGWSS